MSSLGKESSVQKFKLVPFNYECGEKNKDSNNSARKNNDINALKEKLPKALSDLDADLLQVLRDDKLKPDTKSKLYLLCMERSQVYKDNFAIDKPTLIHLKNHDISKLGTTKPFGKKRKNVEKHEEDIIEQTTDESSSEKKSKKGTTDAINQLILQSNAEYNRETTGEKTNTNGNTMVEPPAKRSKITESNEDKLINSLEEGLRTKVKILLGAIAAKDNDFGFDLTKNKIYGKNFALQTNVQTLFTTLFNKPGLKLPLKFKDYLTHIGVESSQYGGGKNGKIKNWIKY